MGIPARLSVQRTLSLALCSASSFAFHQIIMAALLSSSQVVSSCAAFTAKKSAVAAKPLRLQVSAMKVKKGINRAAKLGAPNTGVSKEMQKKGWIDAQGNKGKGYGVYRFSKKYGANVDGYSPIYSPGEWSSKGDTYDAGVTGLAIWAAGFALLLATGGYAIYATSALS